MTPPPNDVSDYFAAPMHPYWLWQDDGNVIAWADGTTIAFRAELVTVLERLRSQSLPPIGAVVLLLAACRDSWRELPNKIGLLYGVLASGGRPDRAELLNRVAARLDHVRTLSAGLRSSLEAKAELAAMVFEGQGDALSPHAFDQLIEALEQGGAESYAVRGAKRSAVDWLLRDLAWLDRGLDRVDEKALQLRVRTGLEQPPAPAPVEVPVIGTARTLLSQLKTDPELGGVARLAQLLLAAVNLPRPLSLPEELPVGGVSDISNRGSLDRLLLSELANDELTLAVRVAMNEALYLRRETPPRTPSRRRLVLLDSGLRMWGVPRVFATAVGLAVAAGAEEGIDVDVYRAAGVDLEPVDMTAAVGLTEHLAALDHRAHPGEALDALRAAAAEAGDTTDVVVVTGDDVLADRAFQRALDDAQFPELHLATVARDGSFALQLRTLRGRKTLRQAQFSLDDVLQPTEKPTTKLWDPSRSELPEIFSLPTFPLLLSVAVDADRSWHVRDFGVLTYTRDGRLLHWTSPKCGGRQLAEDLPTGNLHWSSTRVHDGTITAVVGKLSREGLYVVRVSAEESTTSRYRLQLNVDQPKRVFVHAGIVFIDDGLLVAAYSSVSGKLLASRSTAGMQHQNGRYYTYGRAKAGVHQWRAASYNGVAVEFEIVNSENKDTRDPIVTMFDCDGLEGPVALLKSGNLYDPGNSQKRIVRYDAPPGHDLMIRKSSRDGRLLHIEPRESYGKPAYLVDAVTLAVHRLAPNDPKLLETELFAGAKPVNMRHRFQAVGVDVSGKLTLVGRHDTPWVLQGTTGGSLVFPAQPSKTELRFRRSLELLEELSPNPYALSVARFHDGSRILLDGRGLLHLQSSEKSLPEITIVLKEGDTSGWMSDGQCWGSGYFLGDRAPTLGLRPEDHVRRFTELLT